MCISSGYAIKFSSANEPQSRNIDMYVPLEKSDNRDTSIECEYFFLERNMAEHTTQSK